MRKLGKAVKQAVHRRSLVFLSPFLPDSACIPIFVLYFPWDAYSSADAGRILKVVLSLQCLSFCFHTALSLGDISQSGKGKFSWLQRLA